ncbi:MAG: RluA family pseudouridine synthase [Sulfurovum sp.]
MPFVKEKFIVEVETIAFLYVMRTLGFTQGQAQRHIAKGRLIVGGESMTHTGQRIQGEVVMVFFRASGRGRIPLFQNRDFMIFEKPSGILVHPNTMATPYSMLDEVRTHAGDNANSCHRIDMETSGLLLASKHKKAETILKGLFQDRKIKKSYLAWIDGKLTEPFSSFEPIKINNDYSKFKYKVYIDPLGKPSHTDFLPLKYDENLDASLVACFPHTGRTHQIRVHLFHVKRAILGDPIYGTSFETADDYLEGNLTPKEKFIKTGASRLMLHAHSLEFEFGNRFYIESRYDFAKQIELICPKSKRRL